MSETVTVTYQIHVDPNRLWSDDHEKVINFRDKVCVTSAEADTFNQNFNKTSSRVLLITFYKNGTYEIKTP